MDEPRGRRAAGRARARRDDPTADGLSRTPTASLRGPPDDRHLVAGRRPRRSHRQRFRDQAFAPQQIKPPAFGRRHLACRQLAAGRRRIVDQDLGRLGHERHGREHEPVGHHGRLARLALGDPFGRRLDVPGKIGGGLRSLGGGNRPASRRLEHHGGRRSERFQPRIPQHVSVAVVQVGEQFFRNLRPQAGGLTDDHAEVVHDHLIVQRQFGSLDQVGDSARVLAAEHLRQAEIVEGVGVVGVAPHGLGEEIDRLGEVRPGVAWNFRLEQEIAEPEHDIGRAPVRIEAARLLQFILRERPISQPDDPDRVRQLLLGGPPPLRPLLRKEPRFPHPQTLRVGPLPPVSEPGHGRGPVLRVEEVAGEKQAIHLDRVRRRPTPDGVGLHSLERLRHRHGRPTDRPANGHATSRCDRRRQPIAPAAHEAATAALSGLSPTSAPVTSQVRSSPNTSGEPSTTTMPSQQQRDFMPALSCARPTPVNCGAARGACLAVGSVTVGA